MQDIQESYDFRSSSWRGSSSSSSAAAVGGGGPRYGISRGNGDPWLDLQQIRK